MFEDKHLNDGRKTNNTISKKTHSRILTAPKYRAYTLSNFKTLPQIQEAFSDEQIFEMEVVGRVLPFKVNNYVVEELINWSKVPEDPMFRLTFPQREMLKPEHFDEMAQAIKSGVGKNELNNIALKIRNELNPHPAGQADYNAPVLNGEKIPGMQHKYNETVLYFPKQGQTCHAYCTFCFRWPQFVKTNEEKFSGKEFNKVIEYMQEHKEVTDILFTGGDPMVMNGRHFAEYANKIVEADLNHIKNIRIGTKALAYWPYKFFAEPDSEHIIYAIEKLIRNGKHVSVMAHFNHYNELRTAAVRKAIRKIRNAGAQIRTQSPIFKYINDSSEVWAKMWREQVKLGCVPYYMFMARDTGAQQYFKVSMVKAWKIFKEAYSKVSGLARTARGPVMSAAPGKVQMLGVSEADGKKIMTFRFLQGRNSNWVHKPFFAEYDENAIWIDDLKPAFGEKEFFYENELEEIYQSKLIELNACQ